MTCKTFITAFALYLLFTLNAAAQRPFNLTVYGNFKRTFTGAKTRGKLVGFYSAEEQQGVITHPGQRFHIHYADNNLKTSGHLDNFGIAKGAKLLLPKQ